MHSFLNDYNNRMGREEELLEGEEFWKGPQTPNIHRNDGIHLGLVEAMLSLRAQGKIGDEIGISMREGEFVRVVLVCQGCP